LIAFYDAGRGSPPVWVLILEAAGYDPLRAQEIEDNLTETWWNRWMYDREQRIKIEQAKRKTHG